MSLLETLGLHLPGTAPPNGDGSASGKKVRFYPG